MSNPIHKIFQMLNEAYQIMGHATMHVAEDSAPQKRMEEWMDWFVMSIGEDETVGQLFQLFDEDEA